jgi:hypothetical protein
MHWKDFLNKASLRTMWKATPYLGPRDNYTNIPVLKVGYIEFLDNQDKARVLIEYFFP